MLNNRVDIPYCLTEYLRKGRHTILFNSVFEKVVGKAVLVGWKALKAFDPTRTKGALMPTPRYV